MIFFRFFFIYSGLQILAGNPNDDALDLAFTWLSTAVIAFGQLKELARLERGLSIQSPRPSSLWEDVKYFRSK